MFASLISSAPEEKIVTFEDPDIVDIPLPLPKAPRENGRAKKTAIQALSQVVTWSSLKLPFEPPTFP